MRRSTDAILTSHAGSLPRPDDLIEANRQREAGQGRRGAVPEEAHPIGGRRRAPPGRRRHHRPGRRRVRQVDGLEGQLPRLVELLLHAAGRASGSRTSIATRCRSIARRRATPCCRPSPTAATATASRWPIPIPSSGITTGPRPTNWPFAVEPVALHRPRRDRRRHRQLQGGAEGQRRQRGLHDLDRPGELRAHRQPPLQERRRVRVRLRRRHARGIQGDRRCRAGAADRRSGDRRELRPDQSRADLRGIPQVHRAQDRGAEPGAARACRRTASASISAGAAGTART